MKRLFLRPCSSSEGHGGPPVDERGDEGIEAALLVLSRELFLQALDAIGLHQCGVDRVQVEAAVMNGRDEIPARRYGVDEQRLDALDRLVAGLELTLRLTRPLRSCRIQLAARLRRPLPGPLGSQKDTALPPIVTISYGAFGRLIV